MKKLNYLLLMFAVVFTAGFSSCGGDEEVAPREEKLTSEQITELLNGNVYDGEVFWGDEDESREVTIVFIENSEFSLELSGNGVPSINARGWEVKSDSFILIKRVNGTSSDQNIFKIEEITSNYFILTTENFNDGGPVRVTKR